MNARFEQMKELLGVQYPIIQGGMAWVADASLAAGVSNGGGLGLIGSGSADAAFVAQQIDEVRAVCDKSFGVNIMLMNPYAEEIAKVLCEKKVSVVTTGAGNPGKYISMWKEAGITVIPVVPSAALAKRMQRAGADAVVAEGCEAGGHIGELTTMALIPQVCDAVDIPVIAAGGMADGRGMAAAMMLGASGVQLGTRFLVAKECTIHQNYKDAVLSARDSDTSVTGRSTGAPVRSLKNQLTRKALEVEAAGCTRDEFEELCVGSLRAAVKDGDVVNGSLMAGQSAGLVKREQTAGEMIRELFDDMQLVLDSKGVDKWEK